MKFAPAAEGLLSGAGSLLFGGGAGGGGSGGKAADCWGNKKSIYRRAESGSRGRWVRLRVWRSIREQRVLTTLGATASSLLAGRAGWNNRAFIGGGGISGIDFRLPERGSVLANAAARNQDGRMALRHRRSYGQLRICRGEHKGRRCQSADFWGTSEERPEDS